MWPRSDLTDLLGIDHPIIQAPMAGSDGPALAAAVSNAGGVGSLGCGEMSVEKLREAFDETRSSTIRPFVINFFAHDTPVYPSDDAATMRKQLATYYEELGLRQALTLSASPMRPFDAATSPERTAQANKLLSLLLAFWPPLSRVSLGQP
jgi:nitronate monooxygenase